MMIYYYNERIIYIILSPTNTIKEISYETEFKC